MVRVKVCGVTRSEEVDLCVAAGVDALGFIFAPGPRGLTALVAEALTRRVPAFVTCVGVFANNAATEVSEAVDRCRLDVLQFSGDEPSVFCAQFGKPTIRVIHVCADRVPAMPGSEDLKTAGAVALMVDSHLDGRFGGTGVPLDLELAAGLCRMASLPFVLAGGLRPNNVAAAIGAVRPWAVDVRSGVERKGEKDRILVERFMREVHAAGGGLGELQPLGGI